MQLDKILIGLLVFSFVIVGSVFVLSDVIVNYDLNVTTDEFNETYNKIDETYNLSRDIEEDMLEGEVLGGDESWTSSVKNTYKSVRRTVSGSFGLIITIVQEIAKNVGIPTFVVTMALAAISIVLLFSMIYMIFRFKG